MTKGEGRNETERRITWKERHTVTSHNALKSLIPCNHPNSRFLRLPFNQVMLIAREV